MIIGIFNTYNILNESNVSFIKGYSLHFLPAERRASHDAAIKVMKRIDSIMELEILSNLGHKPSFDEIMNNAKIVSHINNTHKDYTSLYNALVGFEYHYYDIIIDYIHNNDDTLLRKAAKEYSNKIGKNPSLSKIKGFKPTVTLPVKESIDTLLNFEFDDCFDDELE